MSKFILPKITDIMDRRQGKIDDYLEKARENKTLAEKSLENYHRAIAEATTIAHRSLEEMQKELEDMVARKQKELHAKLNKQISESEERIGKSKDEALAKMREMSEDLAGDLVKKIGIKNVTAKDIREALSTQPQD